MGKKVDRTGWKYGRLTVLSEAGKNKHKKILWNCSCSCGNKTIVCGSELQSGDTKSCGCLQKEMRGKTNLTHGLTKHPLYSIWFDIKRRCQNKSRKAYKNYGGRGITVCPKWNKQFLPFYVWAKNNGWEKGLTIDRIDNDGNYCPENCQFITRGKNVLNTRLLRKTNTSGYRGVYFHKQYKKYVTGIRIKGNYKFFGPFDNPIEAANRYDREARKVNDGRPINFP